jgi:phosphoribosyl 1,2-cyclic phosphate phosphodiesterase
MRLTILGCGTSTGVPVLCCPCSVCRSKNPKNKRLRASAWLEINGKSFLIDTSTDLRQQAFRAKIKKIDAVLYTHPHTDHIHGIDELRSFNYAQKTRIPLYGNEWTCTELKKKFSYIFSPDSTNKKGGGIPMLDLHLLDASLSQFEVLGETIIPISVQHGAEECVGYRIRNMAYVTDCSYIPAPSIERLKGLSVLILDCVQLEPHGTHYNLTQALQTIEELNPGKTFLTHLGHKFDYHPKWRKKLPKDVFFAYDGLVVSSP